MRKTQKMVGKQTVNDKSAIAVMMFMSTIILISAYGCNRMYERKHEIEILKLELDSKTKIVPCIEENKVIITPTS